MPSWWEDRPAVYAEELQRFAERGLQFHEDAGAKAAGRVVLRGVAPIAPGEVTELIVSYPETFPLTRFSIFAPTLSLPRHQGPDGGNLCVLPEGHENWRPSYRAADFVADNVPELIAKVREGGDALRAAEAPQGEPFTGYLPPPTFGAVLVPEQALRIDPAIDGGSIEIRFQDEQPSWLKAVRLPGSATPESYGKALLTRVWDSRGNLLSEADDWLKQRFRGATTKALWSRVRSHSTSTGSWIATALRSLFDRTRPNTLAALDRCSFAALVFSEEVDQGTFGDGWIIGVRPDSRHAPGPGIKLLPALRFSAEQCSARIPELYPLRDRSAVVVGAGAIGAPIVVELARALIREVRVVDPDYVDPAGGVRWVSGFDGAGALKTSFLRSELARTYPLTKVIPVALSIGDPSYQPPFSSIEPALDGADIVIDATAEPFDVGRAIAELCAKRGLPLIAVWSQEGYGGYVARIRPDHGGCHYCLLRAISEHGHIRAPPIPAEPKKSRVQPRGCRAPTYTGSALELAPLSAQAARLAVSTLCTGQRDAYPPIAEDVFVLAMRDPGGALLTPTWTAYGLPRDPACPVCA